MKTFRVSRWIFLVLSQLLHLTAFLQFYKGVGTYSLPVEWTTDFYILISLSSVFTLIIYLSYGKRNTILLFFILRSILFFIIGIPFSSFLDVEYMLLFSLLADINLFTGYPANMIISLVILIISMFLQHPMSIYSIYRSAPDFISMLTYGIFGSAIIVLSVILRKLFDDIASASIRIDGMNGMVTRLIGINKGYLEYASKVKNESTKNERARIIQELHDIVGKSFTNIFAMMDASLKHPPTNKQEQEEIYTWAKEQSQSGLDETRAVLYRMREMKDPEMSGPKAILNLVGTFKKATRVDVDISWGNFPAYINPTVDLIIYNVIQESLVNAFRHGNATHIEILFWLDDMDLIISIIDNGKGSSGKKKGIGQSGMEKQINKVNGSIIFRQVKDGYKVYVSIPRERILQNE